MNAVEKAKLLFAERGMNFQVELDYWMVNGYTYCDPKCIIWARPEGEMWFIYLAVGKGCISKFLSLMPFRLEFVSYYRRLKDSKLRVMKTTTLERIVNHVKR